MIVHRQRRLGKLRGKEDSGNSKVVEWYIPYPSWISSAGSITLQYQSLTKAGQWLWAAEAGTDSRQ